MATSNNKSTWLIALDTHPNKRNKGILGFHFLLVFPHGCFDIIAISHSFYNSINMSKKFILKKLVQSNTSTDTDQQSDTSLVFRMKENRWAKPTQATSSSEMDDNK